MMDAAQDFQACLVESGEDIIVVEAKFSLEPLGRSNFGQSKFVLPDGSVKAIPQAGQVEQLDGNWIRARIREPRRFWATR